MVAYMSAAFARFEQAAYALRAEGRALNADRLNALCEAAMAKVWGDAVTDELGSGKLWWASLPHFVHARFYHYAYTFAFLLAAGLVARSREPGFGERYEHFLTAGGSASSVSSGDSCSVARSSLPSKRSSRFSASTYLVCALPRCLPTTSKSARKRSKSRFRSAT